MNLNDGSIPTKEQAAVLRGMDKRAREALRRDFGLTVAYGLNTLQKRIQYGAVMEPMAHNYKKVKTVVTKTDMRYGINSSTVTAENERDANLDIFRMTVDNNLQNDRATQNIAVKGYASPDGPEALNDKLSKARSESSKRLVAKLLSDTGLEVDAAAYGEDWDGFRELIEQSNIEDKNLILQVLSLYNSPVEREKEIKNLSSVFEELKSDVLPELRRAQIINSTDVQGNTDDEILEAVRSGRELTVEEYLYAAGELTKDPEQQVKIRLALEKIAANETTTPAFITTWVSP